MKICIIAPKAYQLFNPNVASTFGGAEVQLFLLSQELHAQGHNVMVVTADYGQQPVEVHSDIQVYKSFEFTQPVWKRFARLFRIVRSIDADAYIQRTLTPFAAVMALYALLRRKKSVYMIAHDGEVAGSHSIYSSLFGRAAAWIAFHLSTVVITQNTYQQEALTDRSGIRAVHIASGYPLTTRTDHEKQIDVLWVGRAEEWKQPTVFIEIAKLFPDKRFTMIAPAATADPLYATKLKKSAANIPNLTFIDYVPFQDIQKYFDQSHIYMLTSVAEGFPNTFIQAALAGVPVLSLQVNPNNVLSGDAAIGVCTNGNTGKLIDELKNLSENNTEYARLSANARSYAEQHHNIVKTATTLIEAIS